MDLVVKTALAAGAAGAFPCSHWAHGGKGIVELAQAVADACAKPNEFKFLYPLEWSLKEKIEAIGLIALLWHPVLCNVSDALRYQLSDQDVRRRWC